jgi:UDP-GlcNAc:undecaprenyl-phosphate/decaprenyl-phosphate GlcNAc-1-phosphate transferase
MIAVSAAVAVAVGLLLSPLAAALGPRIGAAARPRLYGAGAAAVSYLGGGAVAVAVAAGALAGGAERRLVLLILVGGGALLLLGLADDVLGGLPPAPRVVAEVAVGAAAWWAGLRPDWVGPDWADLVLTVFVLVAAANALNLLDNMDGVAASTAAAGAGALAILAAIVGQPGLAVMATAVAAASVAFLPSNLRGRLYLGDGGALFLGFVLAGLALSIRLPLEGVWRPLATALVLGVLVTDTAIVVASRLLGGRPVFRGGTDHVSHRLAAFGVSEPRVALAHVVAGALAAALVIGAAGLGRPWPVAIGLGAFAAAAVAILVASERSRTPGRRVRPRVSSLATLRRRTDVEATDA